MAFTDNYYSGQGCVYVANRISATGEITDYRDVGNVPALRVSLETDVLEHKESRSGQRLIDLRLTRENRARVTMTLEKFTKENLKFLLYGTETINASTTAITGEIMNTTWSTVAIGQIYFTKLPNVTSVVVKGGSTTLVLNTDYSLDATKGLITILAINVGPGPTDDLTVDYTAAAYESVVMFRDPQRERALKFTGLNTADAGKQVIIDLWKVIFDPISNFDLINDEVWQGEIEGSVLYDTFRAGTSALGGFGRVIE